MNYVKDFLFVATVIVVAAVAMHYFKLHASHELVSALGGLAVAFVLGRYMGQARRARATRIARAARTPQANPVPAPAPAKIAEKP